MACLQTVCRLCIGHAVNLLMIQNHGHLGLPLLLSKDRASKPQQHNNLLPTQLLTCRQHKDRQCQSGLLLEAEAMTPHNLDLSFLFKSPGFLLLEWQK